jgi:hypothetical protein
MLIGEAICKCPGQRGVTYDVYATLKCIRLQEREGYLLRRCDLLVAFFCAFWYFFIAFRCFLEVFFAYFCCCLAALRASRPFSPILLFSR